MMFWYGNGMSGWGYALMTVSMVLFWALVIAGLVALVRVAWRDPATTTPRRRGAEQLLDERFARGDIDEEEYRRRREILGEHAA